MDANLHALVKELRREVSKISTKELTKLDRSDQFVMKRRLEKLINEVVRVQHVGKAKCTVVFELFEEMGGTVVPYPD